MSQSSEEQSIFLTTNTKVYSGGRDLIKTYRNLKRYPLRIESIRHFVLEQLKFQHISNNLSIDEYVEDYKRLEASDRFAVETTIQVLNLDKLSSVMRKVKSLYYYQAEKDGKCFKVDRNNLFLVNKK